MALFSSPEKEGLGVSKDAPETRGFVTFFKTLKQYYGALLVPNFLSVLFNILFIPSGLGAVGSAKIARIAARGKHAFTSDYFDAIKENLKLALVSGILNNFIFVFTLFQIYTMAQNKNFSVFPMAVCILALILISFIKYYTPAIMLTFNVTFLQLYKNAVILSFLGIGRNALIALLHLLSYAVILLPLTMDIYVGTGVAICLYLLFIPVFRSFSTQYNIFPVMYKYMIKPFMENHPGEGQKTLAELGLIECDEKAVMSDTTENA